MPALTRPQPDTLRAILYALGANIAITVVKFLGAALTGSGALLAEGISLRMLLKQVRKVRGEHSLWRWFRETRRSELIVVLSEDLAAIAGLSLALAALLATIATGDALYDALGSIGIGALLML